MHDTALPDALMHDDDRRELLRLEQAMWSTAQRYDPAFQQRHFAADFLEFGRSGRIHDRTVATLSPGPDISAQLIDLRMRVFAADLVQVLYDSVVRIDAGELQHAHRSSLWSRQAGTWEMRVHQATPFDPSR